MGKHFTVIAKINYLKNKYHDCELYINMYKRLAKKIYFGVKMKIEADLGYIVEFMPPFFRKKIQKLFLT